MIQYKTINQLNITLDELKQWAAAHETDEVVALAIFAISGPARAPQDIWSSPSQAEEDHVMMAVDNYVANGLYESQDVYHWGESKFTLAA